MRYPNWFPRPKSWLQAIVLLLSLIPIVFAIMGISLVATPTLLFAEHPIFNYFIVAIAIAFLVIPLWIFAHIHQFLWGEPNQKFPKWIPSLRSWGEAIFAAVMIITSALLILLKGYIHLEATGEATDERWEQYISDNTDKMTIALAILSAYGYHLKYLIAKRFQPKQTS
jgi:hypothetical protein